MVVLSTALAGAVARQVEQRLDRDRLPSLCVAHPTAPSTCHRFAGTSVRRSAGRTNMLNVTTT